MKKKVNLSKRSVIWNNKRFRSWRFKSWWRFDTQQKINSNSKNKNKKEKSNYGDPQKFAH